MVKLCFPVWFAASFTCAMKVEVFATVGVPVIIPLLDKVRFVGNPPDVIVQV